MLPLLTVGCGVTVRNHTPQAMPRNPSGLYVVSVEVTRPDNTVVAGSVQPYLVLPDQTVPMVATPRITNRWEYTVAVPADATQWPYYFKVEYLVEKWLVKQEPRTQFDPPDAPKRVYKLYLTDRTAANLDARRGRVGSTIKALGRGFTPEDQVLLNGQAVPTRFESENTLSFQVPAIAGNKTYAVEVSDGGSTLKFGELLVDTSTFGISPKDATFVLAAKGTVVITLPQPAPDGGLLIRIEPTDPTLLDLADQVTILEGRTQAHVPVKARHVGSGAITLAAEGFHNGTLPFRVVAPKER
jgi:hypothetical protein